MTVTCSPSDRSGSSMTVPEQYLPIWTDALAASWRGILSAGSFVRIPTPSPAAPPMNAVTARLEIVFLNLLINKSFHSVVRDQPRIKHIDDDFSNVKVLSEEFF